MLPARLDSQQVISAYRRIAPIYDVWGRLTESRAQDRCLEWAAIVDGEDVLDAAVGSGLLFRRILALNPNGYSAGVDVCDSMLERAREKAVSSDNDRWKLVRGDVRSMPWPDNRFDVVFNNYLFDLLPREDFERVLAEFRRVLRPGGRLAMVNMTNPEAAHQRLWTWLYRINPALLGGCRGVTLVPWLEKAGFTHIRRQFVSQLSFPSEVVLSQCP